MDADTDTLATALYAHTDDLLKSYPAQVPYRPEVVIVPHISDYGRDFEADLSA